jgi:uncharacterized protein YaaW (UPF0174 family)
MYLGLKQTAYDYLKSQGKLIRTIKEDVKERLKNKKLNKKKRSGKKIELTPLEKEILSFLKKK